MSLIIDEEYVIDERHEGLVYVGKSNQDQRVKN